MSSIWLAPNVKSYSVAFCENLYFLPMNAGVSKNVGAFMKTHTFRSLKTDLLVKKLFFFVFLHYFCHDTCELIF